MTLDVQAIVDPNRDDYNVIADSKGGDPNHVVVVDAHLDAIYGAGMLDNASGSATILDIAQKMRKVNPLQQAAVHLVRRRGARPAGLDVLRQQPQPDRARQDRLRPRRRRDGDAELRHRRPRPGGGRPVRPRRSRRRSRRRSTSRRRSRATRRQLLQLDREEPRFSSRPSGTDAFSFNQAGHSRQRRADRAGLLQDARRRSTCSAASLGNFEGNVPSTDGGCVDNPFRWCDNLDNNDPEVLTFMSKASPTWSSRWPTRPTSRGRASSSCPGRGRPCGPDRRRLRAAARRRPAACRRASDRGGAGDLVPGATRRRR